MRLAALFLGLTLPAAAQISARFIPDLPANSRVTATALAANGEVLLAGTAGSDAFVARYNGSATSRLFYLRLPDSSSGPLVLDTLGNAYFAGNTTSQDFPLSSGAIQRSPAPHGSAFLLKLDPAFKLTYSTLFGGLAANPYPAAIAINSAGEAFVTGVNATGMTVTEGGLSGSGNFIVRFSAGGDHLIYSITGTGGTAIAVDSDNNAFTADIALSAFLVPITGNAIQKTVPFATCGGTRSIPFPCRHQYVSKVNATGSKLLFSTLMSGTEGESYVSIAVDPHGDLYIAGTTNARDYPVTPDARQPHNSAGIPPPPVFHDTFTNGPYAAYPATGYLTRIAGDGSRILYSTYIGGSANDSIQRLSVNAAGEIAVALRIQSPDFPSLAGSGPCRPDRFHALPAIATLAPDGTPRVTLVTGVAPDAFIATAFDAQSRAILYGDGGVLAAAPPDALICIVDQADYTQAAAIAPGQLLTLSGSNLATRTEAYDSTANALPRTLAGTELLIDGNAVPLTYVSPSQINFEVPYEVAGRATVSISFVTAAGERVERTLPVTPSAPALLTLGESAYPECNGQTVEGSFPALVLNFDGTRNSCDNPAAPGSTVSVFLTGAGAVPPALTGLNPANGLPFPAELFDGYGSPVLRTASVNWAPLGVWQIDFQIGRPSFHPADVPGVPLQVIVNDAQIRNGLAAVWLRP